MKIILKRILSVVSALILAWAFNALLSKRYPAPAISGSNLKATNMLTSDVIRVATWNIHRGKGLDKVRDLSRVAELIKQQGPFDILGLQEVGGKSWFSNQQNQAASLANSVGMTHLFAPTEYRWLRFNQGNGLLFKPSATFWESRPLPYLINDNQQAFQGRSYRNMLIGVLSHQKGEIAVMVTHLDTSIINRYQLDRSFEDFSHLCDRYQKCLMLADLNNEHDSVAVIDKIKQYNLLDATQDTAKSFQGRNVDWIIARGFTLVASGSVPRGISDHGLFWADLKIHP